MGKHNNISNLSANLTKKRHLKVFLNRKDANNVTLTVMISRKEWICLLIAIGMANLSGMKYKVVLTWGDTSDNAFSSLDISRILAQQKNRPFFAKEDIPCAFILDKNVVSNWLDSALSQW